jgi:hypothetical protein
MKRRKKIKKEVGRKRANNYERRDEERKGSKTISILLP